MKSGIADSVYLVRTRQNPAHGAGYEFEVRNNCNETYDMNCCLPEASSRMPDCERNGVHVRIAVEMRMVVCGSHENGSHRRLWEPSFQERESSFYV